MTWECESRERSSQLLTNFCFVADLDPVFSVRLQVRIMSTRKPELIVCHDCSKAVSFSAASCPHCGSTEPQGPYVQSRRERLRHRREERNDHTVMMAVLGCSVLGACYGAITASGALWKVIAGTGYGSLGLLLGVPVAFIINITRDLGR